MSIPIPSNRPRHPRKHRWSTGASFLLAALLLVPAVTGCNALRFGLSGSGSGAAAEEFLLTLGPLDLDAGVDHLSSPQPEPLWIDFPADGWARGFTVEVVDAGGEALPDAVLHHVKVLSPERRELFKPIALRLIGAGSETRTFELRGSLGVPMKAGERLLATAMVHNPTDRALEGVRIQVRIRYVPAQESGRSFDEVLPFFLHVTPPERSSSYDLPPGRSVRSWEARPAVSGRVLAFGGHLHRYGVGLRLEDAMTGAVLWDASPVADAEGDILEVPRTTFVWSRGPRLRADRVYRVTATYLNPTDETIIDGGMGTVAGVLRTDDPWPSVDPDDPVYAFDLRRELDSSHGGAHGGHQH